ncbi:MAG: GNAT family N-acetyltransferase [Alphaproteobacteria bacterium]|nr:GNAT family N-acetyltransferase [Alphaproteobacteria bacterium]
MTNNSAKLKLADLNADNFSGFKEMVLQQADHHFCDYVGSDEKFLAEITNPESPAHVMLAWSEDKNDSVGYVLYNKMYTLKGSEIYIEDIITRDIYRGLGVGGYFFDQLKALAREESHTAVSWVVARDNVHAIRFYEERQNAKPRHHVGYDCTDSLLKNVFNEHGQQTSKVMPLTENQIPDLMGCDSYKLSPNQASFLRSAIKQDHVHTSISRDSNGKPLAILVANANFSSFRTVYGYKIEVLELTDNKAQAINAFKDLSTDLSEEAVSIDRDGHMVLFIDPTSEAQQEFVEHIDGEPYKMSEHENSFLDLYAIDAAVIYANTPEPKERVPSETVQFFIPQVQPIYR